MKVNHIHVNVRDLQGALAWLLAIWDLKPAFYKEAAMATFQFESFVLILDAAEADSQITIGFETANCDADYDHAVRRGAMSLKEPANAAWGARSAYIQGPGAIVFEFESEVVAT